MRYIVLIFMIGGLAFAKAQTFEVGLFAGGSNLIGDVGSTAYIAPRGLAAGGVIKWNRSTRHSFRASLIGNFLRGDDDDSSDESRKLRGLSFNNKLIEGSLGIEYNFWDYELYSGTQQFTPYIYSGLSVLYHSNTSLNGRSFKFDGWTANLAIPVILGMKANVTPKIIASFEIGARYTLTDNLDGSNPGDESGNASFGNINNNDWFVFTGFTVSYTFGRQPCYCNF